MVDSPDKRSGSSKDASPTVSAFDKAGSVDEIKTEQEIQRRFKTPEGRQDARDVIEVFKGDLEDIDEVQSKKLKDLIQDPRHPPRHTLWPPEYAKYYNEQLRNIDTERSRERDHAAEKRDKSLREVEALELSRVIKIENERSNQKLLVWQPDRKTRLEMEQDWNRTGSDWTKEGTSREFDVAASSFRRNDSGTSLGDVAIDQADAARVQFNRAADRTL